MDMGWAISGQGGRSPATWYSGVDLPTDDPLLPIYCFFLSILRYDVDIPGTSEVDERMLV